MAVEHEEVQKQNCPGEDAPGYFEQYSKYASVVRHSFFAYGVGGAVLFIAYPQPFEQLTSLVKNTIVNLFLVGVALQIFLAVLNKYLMLCIYRGKIDKQFSNSRIYKVADRWSELFIVDIVFDVITLLCFSISTVMLVHML